MVRSKITLYSEKELIEDIKKYAKNRNTSVSKIVNEFFKNLLRIEEKSSNQGTITRQLRGVLRGIDLDDEDFKKHLAKKHR